MLSWGSNSHGQLGLGQRVPLQHTPALVTALTGVAVTQISAGGSHTLFLTLPGQVYCCGANKSGQLGLNRVDEKGTSNFFWLRAVCCSRLVVESFWRLVRCMDEIPNPSNPAAMQGSLLFQIKWTTLQ